MTLNGLLSMLLILAVGVSAITTASLAQANTTMRLRDRSAFWAATAALALVLMATIAYTLTSFTETR